MLLMVFFVLFNIMWVLFLKKSGLFMLVKFVFVECFKINMVLVWYVLIIGIL